MASENIYVFPNTCDNIFVINPNKVTNEYGNSEDRNIKQENLIYYANLECNLEPRSRLVNGTDKNSSNVISLASMNFLNPTGDGSLTTDWTSIQDRSVNQNQIASQLLGMKAISYRVGLSYIPTVTISLEDVKGRALFESGDNSPYSAFFNLPYPTFYLTLKGYYGKAVQYPLILQKFSSSFNSSTGNFDISLVMIGYKFNVLTDITMAELFAVPQMYVKRTQTPGIQNGGNQTQTNTESITQKGYQKILEVYKDYKNLGLIDKDFPELTIQQLSTKLDNFITYNLAKFGQANLTPLNDIDTYNENLTVYRGQIYSYATSFFNLNLDQVKFFVTNEINGVRYKIYTYKESNFDKLDSVSLKKIDLQYSNLQSTIIENNKNLANNETFGNGEYKINNPITINSISIEFNSATSLIDYGETFSQRNNGEKPTLDDKDKIENELYDLNGKFGSIGVDFLFQFDGPGRFLTQTYDLNKILEDKKIKIEDKLTKELSSFIQTTSGLGFSPTIRNIVAVIMASAEAFLRLMDDVHENAWKARNSEIKKLSTSKNDSVSNLSPVFPWPQFLVEKDINGQKKLEIQYPGEDSVISVTKGNDYSIWPEVEFVEEFLKGYLQREVPPVPPAPTNDGVNRVLVSAFDTKPSNEPYSNLETSKFLYEIWERIQTISSYNGFQKTNTPSTNQNILNFIADIESINVYNALNSGGKENSPSINYLFKTENFTQESYYSLLVSLQQNFSLYSQGYFVTDYLNTKINSNPNEILSSDLPIIEITPEREKNFEQYLESNVHNDITFTDTYPFTDSNWNYTNIAGGQGYNKFNIINSTNLSIYYNNLIKKVTNFKDSSVFGTNGDKKIIRPFTDYDWQINTIILPVNLQDFYSDRKSINFVPTEGYINYLDSNFTNKQTTSILNTPYFINAIQKGINGYLSGESSPYKEAAFLFLNSLPLSTLRERYLSYENNLNTSSDFIFAGLKKFGAIHRLPLFWLLKIGSIWNRYKNYINNNEDLLTNIWDNFDYLGNYDPINNSPSTTYVLTSSTFNNGTIVLESNQSSSQTYNIGFYPKLINEFYKFYNTDFLYNTNVTTTLEIQTSIQNAIDTGKIILFNTNDSNINDDNVNLRTWTVLIKLENQNSYVICPSFGTTTNQIKKECFDFSNKNTVLLSGNTSIHNGAVRLFWGAPNYGYFDTTNLKKPLYDEYFKTIYSDVQQQTTFELFSEYNYSNIEEIFSVFDYNELEVFENKFLEFSKSGGEGDFNFETTFKQMFLYPESSSNIVGQNYNEIVKGISNYQLTNISNVISARLNFDILYKRSNPTGFDTNLFNILSSNPSDAIVNRYNIKKYDTTPNSVPTDNVINYLESLNLYPQEWKAMKLYIGYSTISGLDYNGSVSNENYLTNFFRVFDIAFTVDNIILFRNLIKIYGANSIRNASNETKFKNLVSGYLTVSSNLSGQTFTNFITSLKKKFGLTQENPQKIDSAIDGFQSKVELYDMFKAINDKWIAGNNYSKVDTNSDAPLLRDYLFLDRGNRNVGDIFVDISKVNSYLKGADIKSNVFTVVGSIIKDHNFVSFLMPAYINFYGRQTPVGEDDKTPKNTKPDEFANNLFGTFDTVDYQSSKPKMLNIYVDKPSQQTDNKSKANGYKDDGLDITICSDNTIAVDASQKRNYSLENKVVGFAVDFELQNQGVFKKINVSQDLGKATSESLMAQYNLSQSSNGTKTSTQNVSLYNIYKTRSYAASVECMGNAMLQPSMYFVLRNIPLFAGSYFVTEVNHSISIDDFSTSISGTRQAAPTLPKVDTLFQTIKKELLTNLGNVYKNKNRQTTGIAITNIGTVKNSITNSLVDGTKRNSNAATCDRNEAYVNYVKFVDIVRDIDVEILIDVLKVFSVITNDKIKLCIFTTIWIESGITIEDFSNRLRYYGHNSAGVTLIYDYPGNLTSYFLKKDNKNYYMCLENSKQYTQPYAVFTDTFSHFNFLIGAYSNYFNEVNNITDPEIFANEFAKVWIEYFPYNKKVNTPTIYNDYTSSNNEGYQTLLSKIKKAFEIYNKVP
jgi:hypothetical protein